MKIYLAGKMRGLERANFPAFDYAAAKLRNEGHEVFSPADHDRSIYGLEIEYNPDMVDIRVALGGDLAWICKHADAVALLPGWESSTGATAERATGVAIGATIIILGKDYVDANN